MEKHYKINWKRGLVITPEILIASDNYHLLERTLLGKFLASHLYGVLPGSDFGMEKEISNNCLIVKNLNCYAMSSEGTVIGISKDMPLQKKLPLNDMPENEYYVVLSANPCGIASEDEYEPYIYPDYYLTLKKTSEEIDFGMPVLKIKNETHWEIDTCYIPPSIALNAVDVLLQKYFEIISRINNIIEKYPTNAPNFFQISMLQLELKGFTPEKSPEEWLLLMKKFCWIFYTYLKNENKIDESFMMRNFIEEPFNPNDIEKAMRLGYECFVEIFTIFDRKPVQEEDLFEIKV